MLRIAGGIVIAVVVLVVGCAVLAGIALENNPETKALVTGGAGDVAVEVTGDAGPFRGSLGSGTSQHSVEGTTPQTFTLAGKDSRGIFIAVLSKSNQAGTLRVELKGCPDGQEHVGSTSAAFGLVTVTC